MEPLAITIIGMIFVAYIGLALTLYFMQPSFLYAPVRELPYSPAELGLDFEEVFFKTGDRLQLHGWYIPASPDERASRGGPAPNAEFTVLFCHTNAGNMMYQLDSINIFYNLGLSCFIFDYRGYGISQGRPTEQGTYLDVRAAYRWLTKKKGINPQDVIIFGRSLGGSIAAYLAARTKTRGLVIESAFTTYRAIGRKFYPYMPIKWFARFDYPTIDYVRKVRCPVLVIHSRTDEMIPFEFGLQLYEAANEPKEFVELYGGHNDSFLISGETYKKGWLKWLKSLKNPAQDREALIS
jgi:fermentation-respiration switch protein FrsA (DUF1100 family)